MADKLTAGRGFRACIPDDPPPGAAFTTEGYLHAYGPEQEGRWPMRRLMRGERRQ